MKRAVFFDIDGTLWDENSVIPESTKVAIRCLKENGAYVFICSGRTCAYITNPKLLTLQFDGIIAGCGTYVSFRNETIEYKKTSVR